MRPDSESLRSRDPQKASSSPPRMSTDVKMSTVNRTLWCAWETKPYVALHLLAVPGWDLGNRQRMAKRQEYSLTQCNRTSHNTLGQRSLPPTTFTGNLQRRFKASFHVLRRQRHAFTFIHKHTQLQEFLFLMQIFQGLLVLFSKSVEVFSRKGITWHEWWFDLWTVSMTSSSKYLPSPKRRGSGNKHACTEGTESSTNYEQGVLTNFIFLFKHHKYQKLILCRLGKLKEGGSERWSDLSKVTQL